jgi:MFS family permease
VTLPAKPSFRSVLNLTVLVAALGYFVDIFDLLLFGILRQKSLLALGIPVEETLAKGILLHNLQVWGLVAGGIVWGILGDKRGRLSVLFGSIALYSIANIANAFIAHMPGLTPYQWYAVWRAVAGFGLAGELGAAITLVGETLPKEVRGYGTGIVAGVGVSGAVVANWVGKHLDWNHAYLVGGLLGLALLCLRIGVAESGMFAQAKHQDVAKGDFFSLFTSLDRFMRTLRCTLIAVPLWFSVGILMFYAPEFGKALGYTGAVTAGDAIAACYAGLVVGDLGSGFLSQWMASRKKVLLLCLLGTLAGVLVYLNLPGLSPRTFYLLCFCFGIPLGYWAVFVTATSEQFGTNLRATVTTSVPNFVRWSVSPMSIAFLWLSKAQGWGVRAAALTVGLTALAFGFWALAGLRETHGRDLDFLEGHAEL